MDDDRVTLASIAARLKLKDGKLAEEAVLYLDAHEIHALDRMVRIYDEWDSMRIDRANRRANPPTRYPHGKP